MDEADQKPPVGRRAANRSRIFIIGRGAPQFKVQPRDIFLSAEACDAAASTLTKIFMHNRKIPPEGGVSIDPSSDEICGTVPIMVLQSLSLELYFKCVAYMDNPIVLYEHNLLKLFNGLGDTRRIEIEKRYKRLLSTGRDQELKRAFPNLDISLQGVLTASAKFFEKSRFIYEKPIEAGTGFVAHDVVIVMQEYLAGLIEPETTADNGPDGHHVPT